MTCACGGRKDPRSKQCRSCAARTRWEEGREHRAPDRPLRVTLCQCEHPLTDGDDECIWCGHLTADPDPTVLHPVHVGVRSSMGIVVPLPNVIHQIGIAA